MKPQNPNKGSENYVYEAVYSSSQANSPPLGATISTSQPASLRAPNADLNNHDTDDYESTPALLSQTRETSPPATRTMEEVSRLKTLATSVTKDHPKIPRIIRRRIASKTGFQAFDFQNGRIRNLPHIILTAAVGTFVCGGGKQSAAQLHWVLF